MEANALLGGLAQWRAANDHRLQEGRICSARLTSKQRLKIKVSCRRPQARL